MRFPKLTKGQRAKLRKKLYRLSLRRKHDVFVSDKIMRLVISVKHKGK